jgi:hypothetical protein
MPTAYTSNRKIGALDLATTPLAATNELVINQNGDILKTPLSAVENKIFDAKTAVTAPTGTEVVVVRQTDNSLRQVALSNIVPALNITNAQVSASAGIVDTKLATIATAGKVSNSATTATSANTINAIVARDGSGNFSAGTITATLAGSATGNAATATNLSSNRTFALTGNVTGSTNSNLSSGVSIATTIPNGTVTSAMIADGTIVNADINASAAIADTKLATINTAGKVTNNAVQAVSTNTANRIVARDGSGNFSAGTITATLAGNITGNAATATTATTLATGRTIALTGDVTGTTGTFNGSANVSAATTIANNAVTTAKIANVNVTTAKIADLAVTAAKIAANAVTSSELANSAVATANIANLAVTTAKIADANVTTAKIANGNVTLAKLVTAVQQALVPIGAVQAFAMNSAPAGWLVADGSVVPNGNGTVQGITANFSALHSAVGTTYGVAGALPDLRGYFVRGWGQNTDGTTSGTLGQKQSQSLINHTHSGTTGTDFPGHTHSYNYRFSSFTGSGYPGLDGVGDAWGDQTLQTSGVSDLHQHTFTSSSMSPAGGTETRPANIAMLYCIKY